MRGPGRLATTRLFLAGALAGAVLTGAPPHASAADEPPPEAPTFKRALTTGTWSVGLRYRYENVSEDISFFRGKDGRASTLRSTLSFHTAAFRAFSGFVEIEDVTDVGLGSAHNNAGAGRLSNGIFNRPVVADPDGTEIQQAYARYDGLPGTVLRAGRQEIRLDQERYVGAVGWRQNHQSFDAFRVDQSSIPRTRLTYVLVSNANRIFGDNTEMKSHLLNIDIDAGRGRVIPYVYVLDYESSSLRSLSTLTWGARWRGRWPVGEDWAIPFHAELARQRDAGDNPSDFEADYGRIEVGVARETAWLKAGFERLGADGVRGRFTTPLATLHAYNGWADRFLSTPAAGLEDRYLALGGGAAGVSVTLVYHQFDSDEFDLDYGSEIDAQVVYKAPWKQAFGLKIALYDAQDFSTDTDKVMFWTSYRF